MTVCYATKTNGPDLFIVSDLLPKKRLIRQRADKREAYIRQHWITIKRVIAILSDSRHDIVRRRNDADFNYIATRRRRNSGRRLRSKRFSPALRASTSRTRCVRALPPSSPTVRPPFLTSHPGFPSLIGPPTSFRPQR